MSRFSKLLLIAESLVFRDVLGDVLRSHADQVLTAASAREDVRGLKGIGPAFRAVLCAADALVAKPSYNLFVEAACLGLPVYSLRRDDWPETAPFLDWLGSRVRLTYASRDGLDLRELAHWAGDAARLERGQGIEAGGAEEAAALIENLLRAGSANFSEPSES